MPFPYWSIAEASPSQHRLSSPKRQSLDDGLFKQLKKAVIELALGAELTMQKLISELTEPLVSSSVTFP